MMELIDGKGVAKRLRQELKERVTALDVKPGLAVVIVGENPASKIYVRYKIKACKEVGITSIKHVLPQETTQEELLTLIEKMNNDPTITGILVQMPLPPQIEEKTVINTILPEKDVDGFHPMNVGRLLLNEPCLQSCTPKGIMRLLKEYKIKLHGKKAVVIGRSNIVGKPMAQLLLNENATVTICHSRTEDLAAETKTADIIVAAVGKKNLVTADMVKEGAVVIDVGMNRDDEGLCGDVDFDNVKEKCSHITPVPGGVGPMTIACLLENTLLAQKMQNSKTK